MGHGLRLRVTLTRKNPPLELGWLASRNLRSTLLPSCAFVQHFKEYDDPEDSVLLASMAQSPSRQRSKNFSQHDKGLAIRLLNEHDPNNILASHKWKPEVKAQKESILTTIHRAFTQKADRKDATLLQVLLYTGVH